MSDSGRAPSGECFANAALDGRLMSQMAAGDTTARSTPPVWRLKVELLGVTPTVWRRFDTYADVALSQLHYFIQGAIGWELMHLFSYQDGRGYGSQISTKLRLCDVCCVGEALTYTYDFGDNWQHRVTVEKAMTRPSGGKAGICAKTLV